MSLSKFFHEDEFLEEEAIKSLLFKNIEDFVGKPLPKKKRSARSAIDYWKTTWGLWLKNPEIHNPEFEDCKDLYASF